MNASIVKLGVLPLLLSITLSACNENDHDNGNPFAKTNNVPTSKPTCSTNQYLNTANNSCQAKATQTITGLTLPALSVGSKATLAASSNSGLAVSYASQTTTVCTVNAKEVTAIAKGTCTITANQAGDATHLAAAQVLVNQLVKPVCTATEFLDVANNVCKAKSSQTITGLTLPTLSVGDKATLAATSSSGLAVSYASQTTAVCTVNAKEVTAIAKGTCTITANQAGDATHLAAAQVLVNQLVTPVCTATEFLDVSNNVCKAKATQTITGLALPNPFIVGQSHTLMAKSSAGLAVAYATKTTDVCSVTDTIVKALKGGTCTIETTQAGDDKTLAAEIINASATVNCDDSAGCRVSEQEIILAKDTQFISVQEAKKITDTDIDPTTGITKLKVSIDSTLAKMAVGKIAMIDGGKDSIYPLGLTGRVASSQTIDNIQEIELTPVTLAEAFNKVDVNVAIPLNENTILRTITPTLNDDVVSPVAKSARFAKTSASATKSRGEFAFLSAKYPNKLTGLANGQFIKTDKTETGTEIKFDRPFYDFDGDPSTTDDQIMFTASWKLEDTQQKNEIYFDKSDLFKPVKSVNVQFSGKSTVNGKLSGELKADIADLLDYSAVWEKFEKQAINDAGTASITGLSKDDKKGLIPLVCWVTSNPLALTPVTSQDQFGTVLTVNSALGAVVCVSVKLTMGATGKVEVGLEVSNQDMRYGITGTVDNNGTLNAQMINELQPNAKDLESHKTEIKLPYLKFDGEIKHEFGFDAALDVFVAGIRPVSVGAMVGYGTGVKLRGEVGFKAERLKDLSRYGDFCFSDVQIGMGLKARALAAFGVKIDVNIPLLGKTTIDAGGAGAWYIPKPDDTTQGWQGAWYNFADKTAMCAGKAKVEIPYLVALQGPSTSEGYPVEFTWPEAKAEDFDIANIATDKKTWTMIIDGKEYPFEPNKDTPVFKYVFDSIGKHTATLKITGQLGGEASKTIEVMVKGATVTATPEKTTVGSAVKLMIAQATDVILSVGQKLATVFWSVIDNLGQTITNATKAIDDAFEYAFNLRGEYTVSAQLKDETEQSVGTVLTQKVNVDACVENCPDMIVVSATPSTMPLSQPVTIQIAAENVPNTAIFALEGAVCTAPVLGTNVQGFTTITQVCTPSAVGSTKLTIKPKSGAQTGVTTLNVNVVDAKRVEGKFVVPATSTGVAFMPPVDNESVVGTLGQVLEYGASHRNMTCSFKSTGTTKTYRSYDLVDANGYGTDILPLHNGLPNMALVANDVLIGVEKTDVAVNAGERLSFKLNDNSPADNEGALTVSYSCEEKVTAMTGTFTVPATSETGVAFTSPSSTKPLQCSFTATGLTSEAARTPYIGPNGRVLDAPNFPMPGKPLMALITKHGDASYELVGASATIGVKQNETLLFLTNDNRWDDNLGQLNVTYTCSEIPQPAWTTNPANGHQYAAVDCGTWTQCEAQAVALGGHLVSVNDAAENAWLVSNILPQSLTTSGMWSGLNKDSLGVWSWVSGQSLTYTYWDPSQPDNYRGVEKYGHMWKVTGGWNDVGDTVQGITQAIIEKESNATSCPVANANTIFTEDFNSSTIDSSKWNIDQTEGSVTVANGMATFTGGVHRFPLIWLKENPIPTSGNYSVAWRTRVNKYASYGAGVNFASYMPLNGSSTYNHQGLRVSSWSDNAAYLFVGEEGKTAIVNKNIAISDFNNFEICFIGNSVTTFQNGVQIANGALSDNTPRLSKIFVGNPILFNQNLNNWTNFDVDKIEVKTLP